jgi:hypothetical protein
VPGKTLQALGVSASWWPAPPERRGPYHGSALPTELRGRNGLHIAIFPNQGQREVPSVKMRRYRRCTPRDAAEGPRRPRRVRAHREASSAETSAKHAIRPGPLVVPHRRMPQLRDDPHRRQAAGVGLTEQAARDAGIPVQVVSVGTSANAGGLFWEKAAEGTSQLVIDSESPVIVGATFTRPEVQDMLQAATFAIARELKPRRRGPAGPPCRSSAGGRRRPV